MLVRKTLTPRTIAVDELILSATIADLIVDSSGNSVRAKFKQSHKKSIKL